MSVHRHGTDHVCVSYLVSIVLLWHRRDNDLCNTALFSKCVRIQIAVMDTIAFATGHNPYNLNEPCSTGVPDMDGVTMTTYTGENGDVKRTMHIPFESASTRQNLQRRLTEVKNGVESFLMY